VRQCGAPADWRAQGRSVRYYDPADVEARRRFLAEDAAGAASWRLPSQHFVGQSSRRCDNSSQNLGQLPAPLLPGDTVVLDMKGFEVLSLEDAIANATSSAMSARGRNGGEPGKGHDGSHCALQILDRHVHPFIIDLMQRDEQLVEGGKLQTHHPYDRQEIIDPHEHAYPRFRHARMGHRVFFIGEILENEVKGQEQCQQSPAAQTQYDKKYDKKNGAPVSHSYLFPISPCVCVCVYVCVV
jgi:hypothetical protein